MLAATRMVSRDAKRSAWLAAQRSASDVERVFRYIAKTRSAAPSRTRLPRRG